MITEKSEKDEVSADEEVLKLARERFQLAVEAETDIRNEALDDLKFSAGEQWPEQVKRQREIENRPCLVINRLPQMVRQVTNDLRQSRPSIKVSPVDDKADIETAKVYQGIVRHIENRSNADTAYDTAGDSAVRCGFGFFRVVTEHCDPMSFDQDVRILRVPDRFSCYLDPNFLEPDGSDAHWGFVFEDIPKELYMKMYPDSELASIDSWQEGVGADHRDWIKDSSVRIAEYFVKENRQTIICLVVDPMTGEKQTLEKDQVPEGMVIVDERETQIPEIKWYKINAIEILEKTDWPGKWIPIIPVLGEEMIIEGKRQLISLVRFAKEPQRMYNVWKSYETEAITLAPKAPYLVAEGQIEGYERLWDTANQKNYAYLPYKPKALGGQLLGAPQRNAYEPPIQAVTQAAMLASDEIKATTGIYDAALGNKSNENSGIAIQRRNMQSQTSNFHFADNLAKSIRHCGRIIVDLIPHIYDTPRAARILGEDGTEEIIRINEVFERNGEMVHYSMGAGKYDVTVDTGPSFETKRQEAAASMADLSKSFPQLMQVAGDLMVANLDWPGAKEISERIKKTLPPGLADDGKGKAQLPPEVKSQMDQMNQMIEQLTEQLKHKTEQIDKKALELESRERIEMAKLQANIEIEMAKMGSQESLAMLNHEVAQIEQRLNLLRQDQPFDLESEESQGQEMQEHQGPMAQEPMDESFDSAGAMSAAPMEQQQSTGGFSPGNYMETP